VFFLLHNFYLAAFTAFSRRYYHDGILRRYRLGFTYAASNTLLRWFLEQRPHVDHSTKTPCYTGSDLHWSPAVPAVKLAIVHEFSSFQNFAALVLFHTDRSGTLH